MSSSEEYLDSLLDSILSGGKSEEEEKSASDEVQASPAEGKTADGGKAMSPDEIEEMLVSMGTLGGGEEEAQDSAEDMDAMLAFMNEHDADTADSDFSDDFAIDELSMDDLATDETGQGGSEPDGMDDLSLDEFALDELSMDGLATEETGQDGSEPDGMDDLSLDEFSMGDLDVGENGSDDFAIDELSLDDLSLDNLAQEAPENIDNDADELMSEEDIDRLLSGDMSEETGDSFGLEETGETEGDDDLAALLAGMEHDEDLSEINDLLEESGQSVPADDDMLAMLEGAGEDSSFDLFESDEAAREAESIRELSPEEVAERESGDQGKKKKKKRRKLFGKKKKGGEEEQPAEGVEDELEALLGDGAEQETEKPQKEKKPGVVAKLLDFLLESDEDEDPVAAEILADNAGEMGTVTDENKELLKELSDEDKKGKKKKKDKKGKKGKEGEEDAKKAKKEKKPKKPKKKKEKEKKSGEEVDLLAPPEKKLSKKKVITVFLFCGTIAACIILFTLVLPDTMQRKEALTAYDRGEYTEVYGLLYGKELTEEENVLFQGSNLVLQMNRKLASYDNYVNLDMRLEALNALITGVGRYQKILPEAENYNVVEEVNDIYAQILERLSANFGLSEQDALDILALEDDLTYSQRLESIISGESYDSEEETEPGVQDMLPEEEEIMERIGGADGEAELEVDFEPEDVSSEEDVLPEEEMPGDDQAADEKILDEGAE